MKRTVALVGVLGLSLGVGAGVASAADTGSTAIDSITRAASQEDANGAIATAAGEMTVKGLRECGLGALIGNTTDELSVKNVTTFVSAASKRLIAITNGPAAVISLAAGGCVERALVAFDVSTGSAKTAGSVASMALGGFMGTGSLASASSDSGSADSGLLDAASSDTASSDTASADSGSADTASADSGSLDSGSLDAGSLEASAPVSDALIAGAVGA